MNENEKEGKGNLFQFKKQVFVDNYYLNVQASQF